MNRVNLMVEKNKHIYNLQQFETIIFFTKNIFGGKIILNNVGEDQSNFLVKIMNFRKNTSRLIMLTPKQIFQRLPIALAQIKAGKTC